MLVIAHRGASVARPENRPEAFEAADRMGADGVELDVRLAADGRGGTRLVVHHDPLPARSDELARLPDLDEVLDACGSRMLVNVEIKNTVADGGFDPTMAVVAPTVDALRRRGTSWRHRWLVSSFGMRTVDHVRLVDPTLPTAFLVDAMSDEAIERTARGGHVAIHPSHGRLRERDVDAAHDAGLAVNIWTCNDPDRLVELRELGVDGACTDVPDVALEALGRVPDAAVRPAWRQPPPAASRA